MMLMMVLVRPAEGCLGAQRNIADCRVPTSCPPAVVWFRLNPRNSPIGVQINLGPNAWLP